MSPLPAVFIDCAACGRSFKRDCLKRRFCSKACAKRGSNNPAWVGGRTVGPDGYPFIAMGTGHRRAEHLVIAERALGRPLPKDAEVHHVNGIRSDNRNRNLVICENRSYHRLLEVLMRVLLAGGRPFLDAICPRCGVTPLTNFRATTSRGRVVRQSHCITCMSMRRRAA